jgi:hypothetical protein
MVQTVSLHGAKSQTLARINRNPTEKDTTVKYASPDLRFLSQIKSDSIRAPVHEDFNSFLASSTSQINEKISDATKMAATMQNHRFGPEDGSLQKSLEGRKSKPSPEIKFESTHLDKNNRLPLTDTPRLLEILNSAPVVQPPRHIADKGYGSRMATDPLITLASSTIDKASMGLVGAVNAQSQHEYRENDSHGFNETNQKSKAPTKTNAVSRSEHASLLRREEIDVLRDVKEKFQQQLNAQHPHITVPLKHPEGIVDIHMRFDRKTMGQDGVKGAVRVMFSGSNAQIVTLFAQHREVFMNIITNQGYAIDPSRMQFNGPNLIKSM